MPTPSDGPSAVLIEKILPEMTILASESGWSEANYKRALVNAGIEASEAAMALPDGLSSLIPVYFRQTLSQLEKGLSEQDMGAMRIRDKITGAVTVWFQILSDHHEASVHAFDWCMARPCGPLTQTEFIWEVADTIWNGIGDDATGFTYMSKRTTLSGVLTTTLAVWRKGDEDEWRAFLDRRIQDVMAFEKFKAGLKLPKFPMPV